MDLSSFLFVPNAAPGVPGVVPPPPPPPPDPAVLAQQAYGELTVPKPVAKRSPPEGNSDPQYGGLPYTWVGLWTYIWSGGMAALGPDGRAARRVGDGDRDPDGVGVRSG